MTHPLPAASLDTRLRLEVCLLGRFSVSVAGVELTAERWPSLRATHLVQLLSLRP